MADRGLTTAQEQAVLHRGGSLLVSAAAGSGKTRVLIERLMRRICDENDPRDLSEFLIITYTKAAAAELRDKIGKQIAARLAENATAHLRRQLTQLYLANISTVHSFCGDILRAYSYAVDVPPDFRIAEEQECEPMRRKALDLTIEEACSEVSEPIAAFFNSLGNARNDRATCSMILDLFYRAQCHLYPDQWLSACEKAVTDAYDSIEQTPWGERLIALYRERMEQLIGLNRRAIGIVDANGELEPYRAALEDDLALLQRLKSAPDWDTIHALNDAAFVRLGQVRKCECPEEKAKVQTIRKNYKDCAAAQLKWFSVSSEQAYHDLCSTGGALSGLCALTRLFDKNYSRIKRARRVLDFQDLEHLAVRLLLDRQGRPTAAAKELSRQFCEIMVDEYQDSNELQDAIFRAVSANGENLFFVGDVKQSIYSFRRADPGIFLEKYNAYTETDDPAYSGGRKILLSENFRSGKAVIDAVNHVFSSCMSQEVGGLTYGRAEALFPGRNIDEPSFPAVQLHLIDTAAEETAENKIEAEAHFVAAKIRELLDEGAQIPDIENEGAFRRVDEKDIAIIMRTMQSTAPIYSRVLAQYGIRSVTDRESDIFKTSEVAALYAMLQIICNPHQDVHLVTAMANPVGGFTADELAQIRACDRECDLYDALVQCAQHSEKHAAFLRRLEELREKRRWMRLPELLDYVCRSMDFYSVFGAMEDGAARVANLRKFCELTLSAQTAGETELGAFLRYAERLKENQGVPSGSDGSGAAVRILSIHKSKGLEFPIVFLSDLSRKFNQSSLDMPVLAESELYLGCKVTDHDLMARYPSIARVAIRETLRREMVSEQLRVLYVAMTRAENALIMTYCGANVTSDLGKAASRTTDPVMPFVSGTVSGNGEWILLAAALRPEGENLFGGAEHAANVPGKPWLIRYHSASEYMREKGKAQSNGMRMPPVDTGCLDHAYAYEPASRLPAKLTATQLKGGTLEEESREGAIVIPRKRPPKAALRAFGTHEATSAERGTAIHRFLQFCRCDACDTPSGVQAEAERLKTLAFLTPEQAAELDSEKLAQFFASDPGRRVRMPDAEREFKFSLLVDAKTLLPDAPEEQVMLQGVVDCFWIDNGAITVLDYKTDHIRPGGEAERAEQYRAQLDAYALALERIFGMPVKKRILWFFETETAFELSEKACIE